MHSLFPCVRWSTDRQTLSYALRELEKDVKQQAQQSGRTDEVTQFGIFVLHNKKKPKRGELPKEILQDHYWAAETIPDLWVRLRIFALTELQCEYPWEARDIEEHTKKADAQAS